MRHFYLIFLAILFVLACEPEEEQLSGDEGVQLFFSTDSVIFDTLLTDRTSLTKRFRIYNPNEKAVRISEIRLGKGRRSDYSLIVNGKSDYLVENEILYGGDSLMILVDVEIDPLNQDLPYLVKDSVIVSWNGRSEFVRLVSWGQDAEFIRSRLICDEVWTADRPYVINDLALVDSLCSLTLMPGTKVYLDNNAALFVLGTLKVLGDSGNHVIIRNTRFDENYREAPGQWDAIYFLEGSNGNEIHFAEIENGSIGLRVGTPDDDDQYDLTISHTIIRHMSTAGILAFTSDIYAYNMVVYNAGSFLVGNYAGGNYRYEHCTFSNQPSFFINEDPMVQFSDNLILSDDETLYGDLNVQLSNSIVWGQGPEQILISESGERMVAVSLRSNIIRSDTELEDNYTSDLSDFPGFADPFQFDFQLDCLAFARDKAIPIGISTDILGRERDDLPDIGAYERIDKR